jgi:oxygen-independent coproporphyrinogen-3 oxidase
MSLVAKYNIAAPRYTSYPTVPYWQDTPDQEQWKKLVSDSFIKTNDKQGISLYIHLPFCESLCTYCACNTRITINHKVEESYIETLLKEWDLYLNLFESKPRIKELHLGGGTPTFFSPANLKRLIEGILSKAVSCENADFSFEGHPNNTTSQHLQTFFDLGFTRVSFGVQDLDKTVQEAINRIQPLKNLEYVVSEARTIGYHSINFDLVYGLPFQTPASVLDTVQSVIQLKPERIAFYSYAHVPWMKPGQRKFTEKDLPSGDEKRKLYELGLEQFKLAGYEDVGMDHFALKTDPLYQAYSEKRLHRNFMGYTSNYTELMISLGVSAISDTWTGFSQNIKVVEPYYEAVAAGNFPIQKGHILTEEDAVIRKHILNIMCNYETKWEQEPYNYRAFAEALSRLKELEQDGFVKTDSVSLTVTEKGKAFLRNICLCFDARYWRNIPEGVTFSSAV